MFLDVFRGIVYYSEGELAHCAGRTRENEKTAIFLLTLRPIPATMVFVTSSKILSIASPTAPSSMSVTASAGTKSSFPAAANVSNVVSPLSLSSSCRTRNWRTSPSTSFALWVFCLFFLASDELVLRLRLLLMMIIAHVGSLLDTPDQKPIFWATSPPWKNIYLNGYVLECSMLFLIVYA